MISRRSARPDDAPDIWALLDAHKEVYLDDFNELTPDWVLAQCENEAHHTVLVDKFDVVRGVILVSDIREGLHCTAHITVNPRYWRAMVKADVIGQEISESIEKYKLFKVKASCMKHQKSAMTILRRYGFKLIATDWHETTYKGKPTSVLRYSLLSKHWRKRLNGQFKA